MRGVAISIEHTQLSTYSLLEWANYSSIYWQHRVILNPTTIPFGFWRSIYTWFEEVMVFPMGWFYITRMWQNENILDNFQCRQLRSTRSGGTTFFGTFVSKTLLNTQRLVWNIIAGCSKLCTWDLDLGRVPTIPLLLRGPTSLSNVTLFLHTIGKYSCVDSVTFGIFRSSKCLHDTTSNATFLQISSSKSYGAATYWELTSWKNC